MAGRKGAPRRGAPAPLSAGEIVARCAELVEQEKARRREAARPKPKRWVTLGHEPVVMPEVEQPAARGHYVERTVFGTGPAESSVTQAGAERLLYSRDASLDAPDDKPPAPAVEPKRPTIRVPRRTEVQTGAGEIPPKPTRWGLPPRDGQRTTHNPGEHPK